MSGIQVSTSGRAGQPRAAYRKCVGVTCDMSANVALRDDLAARSEDTDTAGVAPGPLTLTPRQQFISIPSSPVGIAGGAFSLSMSRVS